MPGQGWLTPVDKMVASTRLPRAIENFGALVAITAAVVGIVAMVNLGIYEARCCGGPAARVQDTNMYLLEGSVDAMMVPFFAIGAYASYRFSMLGWWLSSLGSTVTVAYEGLRLVQRPPFGLSSASATWPAAGAWSIMIRCALILACSLAVRARFRKSPSVPATQRNAAFRTP